MEPPPRPAAHPFDDKIGNRYTDRTGSVADEFDPRDGSGDKSFELAVVTLSRALCDNITHTRAYARNDYLIP